VTLHAPGADDAQRRGFPSDAPRLRLMRQTGVLFHNPIGVVEVAGVSEV